MPDNGYFLPGQSIVLREVAGKKIWRASPYMVVRDDAELIVLYSPIGVLSKYHLMPDGKRVKPNQKVRSEWVLADMKWEKFYVLRLSIPGTNYSVLIFWDHPSKKLDVFYINLEDPLRRTPLGFDLTVVCAFFGTESLRPSLCTRRAKHGPLVKTAHCRSGAAIVTKHAVNR